MRKRIREREGRTENERKRGRNGEREAVRKSWIDWSDKLGIFSLWSHLQINWFINNLFQYLSFFLYFLLDKRGREKEEERERKKEKGQKKKREKRKKSSKLPN